jgi:hypothetical protein
MRHIRRHCEIHVGHDALMQQHGICRKPLEGSSHCPVGNCLDPISALGLYLDNSAHDVHRAANVLHEPQAPDQIR